MIDRAFFVTGPDGAPLVAEMPLTLTVMLKSGAARGSYTVRIEVEKPPTERMQMLEAPGCDLPSVQTAGWEVGRKRKADPKRGLHDGVLYAAGSGGVPQALMPPLPPAAPKAPSRKSAEPESRVWT